MASLTLSNHFRLAFLSDSIPHTIQPFSFSLLRGRPWRYSVIPSTPDFQTEYQIRPISNPAGLPVFATNLVPGFRASTIILTHMFKQIKLIRITLMAMFKVHPGSTNYFNEVPVGLVLVVIFYLPIAQIIIHVKLHN